MSICDVGAPASPMRPAREWWEVGDRTYSTQELADAFSSTEPEVKAVYCYQTTDRYTLSCQVANGAIGALNGAAAGGIAGGLLTGLGEVASAVAFLPGGSAGLGLVWALAGIGAAAGAWGGVAAGRHKLAHGESEAGKLVFVGGHVMDFVPEKGEPHVASTSVVKAVVTGAVLGAAAGACPVVPIAGVVGPAIFARGIGRKLTEGTAVIGGGLGAAAGMGMTAISIALGSSSLGASAGLGVAAAGMAVLGTVAGPFVIEGLRRSEDRRAAVLQGVHRRFHEAREAELQKWSQPVPTGQLQQGEEEVVINGVRVRRRVHAPPTAHA